MPFMPHYKPHNHGGARHGAGRKPLSEDTRRVSVLIPEELIARVQEARPGPLSEAIRAGLERLTKGNKR